MMTKYCLAPRFLLLLVPLVAGPLILHAQQPPGDAADTRLDDIIKETQLSIGGKDTAGLVWWLPTEFWERSAIQQGSTQEQARANFAPMRDYTLVIVAVGKIGIGNINWRSEKEIRANTTLRDADGQLYQPLKEISPDAQGIASIVKPILANILGPTGQNLQILFFPAKTAKGMPIADPAQGGSFSVVLSNLTTQKEAEFTWRLPLTSLSAPRYCAVGKERVEVNWKYCPWHGNRLGETAAAPSAVEQKRKEAKPE